MLTLDEYIDDITLQLGKIIVIDELVKKASEIQDFNYKKLYLELRKVFIHIVDDIVYETDMRVKYNDRVFGKNKRNNKRNEHTGSNRRKSKRAEDTK